LCYKFCNEQDLIDSIDNRYIIEEGKEGHNQFNDDKTLKERRQSTSVSVIFPVYIEKVMAR